MRKSFLSIFASVQLTMVGVAIADQPESKRDYRRLPSVRESAPLPAINKKQESSAVEVAVASETPAVPRLDVIRLAQAEGPVGTSPSASSAELVEPNGSSPATSPTETPTQASPSTPASPSDKKDVTKLWDVGAMIGPMNDAATTFSRIGLKDDWRYHIQLIPQGVRSTTDMIVWGPSAYTWTTPVFYHRPLYFEQPNLERYGNGPYRLTQPAVSSAHFFFSVPLVPVKMLHNPPWADIYTLGEGRPGNCVPMQSYYDVMIEE